MASSKPFVLFFNPVKHAQPFYEKLQEVAHTEVVTSKSREEFFKDVEGKYKDIFAIYRTSASGAVSRSSGHRERIHDFHGSMCAQLSPAGF